MESRWRSVLSKCKYEPKIIPILLALLRLLLCFRPQTGYLHPDEMFQSADIIAGGYFDSKINPAWEFQTDRPIRCMLIPHLLNWLAFRVATLLRPQPSAYLLLVAPRLAYTLVSFIVDLCLYKLCQYYSSRGLWYLPVSVVFQSSFICLGCMTRTLSNNIEVVIFSLLLVCVCRLIRPRFRILFVRHGRSSPAFEQVKSSKQLLSSISIGFLISLGTFNRPTFPCFACVPMLYWIVESFKRNSMNYNLTIRRALIPLSISFMITSICISAYDTVYYRGFGSLSKMYLSLSKMDVEDFSKELKDKWILTPYNFFVYNTNSDNLAKYGLHVPYMHTLVNGPVYFNILCLMFYGKLISLLVGSGIYRLIFSSHRIFSLMLLSASGAIILLSFIPHQEFRFLLPIVAPLAYAFAFDIYTNNKLFSAWILINAVLVIFYSEIHQAGVLKSTLDLDPIVKSFKESSDGQQVLYIIALRCYTVPTYLWNIPKMDNRFEIDSRSSFGDFGESLDSKLNAIHNKSDEFRNQSISLYMMLPTLYENLLRDRLDQMDLFFSSRLSVIKHYVPHFSGEDVSLSFDRIMRYGFGDYFKAFGFSLVHFKLDHQDIETNLIDNLD